VPRKSHKRFAENFALARKFHHEGKKVAKSFSYLLGSRRLETNQQETSLMAECSQLGFELPGFNGRKIEGNFQGGNVSSDAGLVVLRQVDRWLGLTEALAKRLPDRRDPDKIEHCLESMLRQRIYGLALGYEDLGRSRFFAQRLAVADRGGTKRSTRQLLDAVPARESRWARGSVVDARGALRKVYQQLRVSAEGIDPGF
jgi:DDE family transposase